MHWFPAVPAQHCSAQLCVSDSVPLQSADAARVREREREPVPHSASPHGPPSLHSPPSAQVGAAVGDADGAAAGDAVGDADGNGDGEALVLVLAASAAMSSSPDSANAYMRTSRKEPSMLPQFENATWSPPPRVQSV